ncbi:MAG: phosphomannomutase/phosphoglucomutase [Acidiferrobacteraceae bacterium]
MSDSGSAGRFPPQSIFKAYDIRGVVGQTLTAEGAKWIGLAIGSELRSRGLSGIVVGRDGRLSGPDLTGALTEGLCEAGCAVLDAGRIPTPVLYFASAHLGLHSGVMVTGSHNPPDYNGFKIVLGGETLFGPHIQALHERIQRGRLSRGKGSVRAVDVREHYLTRITDDVHLARPLEVAIDCGNGVTGELAPELFLRLGCTVEKLFCDVDGNFPNHHPDPSQPANLADLIRAVDAGGAAVGLAFDGDGDRLGVVARGGKIIWPDRQLILFARDVLKQHPGAEIIYDVKCSRTLGQAIREAGGKPVMWKTGHSFIKARLKEPAALLAGEMSGHLFFKDRWYGFDDGLYAGARLLELLSRDRRPSEQVFRELPDTINTPELHIPVADGDPHRIVSELAKIATFPGAEMTTIDGLRVDFSDGWGLVRASNTTPVLVLRFEADTEAALHRIENAFKELLLRVKPDARMPF